LSFRPKGEITQETPQSKSPIFVELQARISRAANDKLTENILMKMTGLALMGGKILLCRGSAQKIGRTAGNSS